MTAAKNTKINLRRVLIYFRQDATNTWMWRETPTRVRVPSPTFCLSRIFIAKYCSVPLCFTSMTLPNEPVPRVFNLSKSSRHVVLCGKWQPVSLFHEGGWTPRIDFSSLLLVEGIPISVRSLLWLWLETLSLERREGGMQTLLAQDWM